MAPLRGSPASLRHSRPDPNPLFRQISDFSEAGHLDVRGAPRRGSPASMRRGRRDPKAALILPPPAHTGPPHHAQRREGRLEPRLRSARPVAGVPWRADPCPADPGAAPRAGPHPPRPLRRPGPRVRAAAVARPPGPPSQVAQLLLCRHGGSRPSNCGRERRLRGLSRAGRQPWTEAVIIRVRSGCVSPRSGPSCTGPHG